MEQVRQSLRNLDRKHYEAIAAKMSANEPITRQESIFWHSRGGERGYDATSSFMRSIYQGPDCTKVVKHG